MSAVVEHAAKRSPLLIDAFRAFQLERPDEEGWELVDGSPVMMTPTHLGHARIAGNVERLLSEALDAVDPSRMALQNIGVDLGLAAETLSGLGRGARYAPQPDIGVIDAAFAPDQRLAAKLHVAVEIVSETDEDRIASIGMRWIDAKTRLYQAHRHCEAIIVVEQHRLEATLSRRSGEAWQTWALTHPDETLELPTCGLTCRLADLYRGTPLITMRA